MNDSGLQPSDLTTLVPLLLLVVERFSSLARESADEPWEFIGVNPLLTPVEKTSDDGLQATLGNLWPHLGRLNIIHATNVMVLGSAFLLTVSVSQSAIRNVVGFVVALIWIQLPLLEVDEYGAIREAKVVPISLYWHALTTLLMILFVAFAPNYEPAAILTAGSVFSEGTQALEEGRRQIWGAVGLTLVGLLSVSGYLVRLESEVEETTKEMNEDTA